MYFDLNGCLECFVCIKMEEVLRIQRRAAVTKQLGGIFLGRPLLKRLTP